MPYYECAKCGKEYAFTVDDIKDDPANIPTMICRYCEEEFCIECMDDHGC